MPVKPQRTPICQKTINHQKTSKYSFALSSLNYHLAGLRANFEAAKPKTLKTPGGSLELEKRIHSEDESGRPITNIEVQIPCDANGKALNYPNEYGIYCYFWQGFACSIQKHGVCAMCKEEFFRTRYVLLGKDGDLVTKIELPTGEVAGNVLCAECIAINEQRKRSSKLKLWFTSQKIY